jgi:hypothetical protein
LQRVWVRKEGNLQIIARGIEHDDGKLREILDDEGWVKGRDDGGCLFRQRGRMLLCRVVHRCWPFRGNSPDRREQQRSLANLHITPAVAPGRHPNVACWLGNGLTLNLPCVLVTDSIANMASRDDGDEDDYLTMTFGHITPSTPVAETYSQRRARKLREHDDQSHIKPAKVLERERREEGLAQNLFSESSAKETKAMRMMKLMGYTYNLQKYRSSQ